jgi:hypothetical protein
MSSSWAPGSPDHVTLRSQGTEGSLFAAQHASAGPVDDGRADMLRAWMQTQATPDAPSARIHEAELRVTHDKGLAVFSSVPLGRGHVALSLGKELLVCEGHLFGWSATYSSVGSILQECNAPMELKLAVFLICARNEQSSSVTGYVNSLPTVPIDSLGGVPASLDGDPDSWGEPERAWADEVAAAEAVLIARADAAEALLRTADAAALFPEDIFSTEALRWALGNVYSRSFQLGGAMIMLPLIDLLNHAKKGSMRRNCEVVVSWVLLQLSFVALATTTQLQLLRSSTTVGVLWLAPLGPSVPVSCFCHILLFFNNPNPIQHVLPTLARQQLLMYRRACFRRRALYLLR